jgi:C-terminal processing protease CtpA/Prc
MFLKSGVRATKRLALFGLLVTVNWSHAQQPQISSLDRGRAEDMLKIIAGEVRKHYYDPKFQGVDWDAKVAEAKQKIEKTTSMNMAMSNIAAALDSLNDSHTFFLPPQHAYRHEYGLQYQIVGNRCFVTRVRPKSDAEAKGVKAGDEIVTLNTYNVNREDLWKVQYVFSILRPQPVLQLALQDPSGAQRQVEIAAKIREGKKLTDLTWESGGVNIFDLVREGETDRHLMRARIQEYGDELMVLKIPEFNFSAAEIADMIDKARKHKNLIVDLRGNPGGAVETLKHLVGGVFDKEVKIADRIGRKDAKPEVAKPLHDPFTGKIVVLVDAQSASASELFARIIQLEKRGIVIGDHSSGSVMEAREYEEQTGTETAIFYGASITESNLVMTDGKSLEHAGVTPDEVALPTAKDIANGRDPVLARAAELLGIKISAEDAAKAFPYEWPPEI